jgi:hypothetical protein
MKIEKKLNQMNMSDLKKICQKMKVNCTNSKKDNINRLLKPLKTNQYKMFRTRANTGAKKMENPSDSEIEKEMIDEFNRQKEDYERQKEEELLKQLQQLSIPPLHDKLTEEEKIKFEQRLKKLEEPYKKSIKKV